MFVTAVVVSKPEHVVKIWCVLSSLLSHVVISLVITLYVILLLMSLATDIRDPSLFVDGFVQYELNQLANSCGVNNISRADID